MHEGQAVELAQRQQLRKGQPARELLVVLDVQVQQVLQLADGGGHGTGELVPLQIQLAELCCDK